MAGAIRLVEAKSVTQHLDQLFSRYVAVFAIHAGAKCDERGLDQVMRKLTKNDEALKRALWRDAETIAYWVSQKIDEAPGLEKKSIKVLTALRFSIRGLLTDIQNVAAVPRAYRQLHEHFVPDLDLDEIESDQKSETQPVSEADEGGTKTSSPGYRTPPTLELPKKSTNPKAMEFFHDGDLDSAFFDFQTVWQSDLDIAVSATEKTLKNLDLATSQILETSLKKSRKSNAGRQAKRGGPQDIWSKRAVLLLACSWSVRLAESADRKVNLGRSRIPKATVFREFVRVALNKVQFPSTNKTSYSRQINEVLSGEVSFSESEIS